MSEHCHVRVSMGDNGVRRELIVDGVKVADLSFVEAIELAMQVTSSLRYEPMTMRAPEPRAGAG